jgi:glycosyltransferase involved in cell wall biosynthesis
VPVLLPLLCRAMGVRVVQTWHEAWPLRALAQVLLLRAGANGLVFVRPSYRQLLPRSLRPLLASLPQATVVSAATLPLSRQSPEEARQVRQRYLQGRTRLVVFFGFVHSAKGIEQLFDIANPETDALVIAGAAQDAQYLGKLRRVAADKGWPPTQVQFTGFLQEQQAADLLAVADAVVLPFLAGAGDWNTSVQGALAQGTLVITTARQPAGDDASRNLYTAAIANVDEMRRALAQLAGRRVPATGIERAWASIADRHIAFYRGLQGTISR